MEKQPHEKSEKDEGENAETLEKFTDLAKRLVKVPREELSEQQAKYRNKEDDS